MLASNEKLEIFGSLLPRDRTLYYDYLDYKAAAFRSTEDEASFEFKARSVFDPKLGRYRCPPGTRHGGRITNRMGVGCGGNIVRRLIGAARRAGRVVDAPSAPRSRAVSRTSRTAERAGRGAQRGARRGRNVVRRNLGRAGEAFQATGRVQAVGNVADVHPYLNSPARQERLGELNAFGRALARFAERVDVDEDELTEIADRTGIPQEELTPERRERLGRVGERINNLMNEWADEIDVDLEEVTGLRERRDAPDPREVDRARRNRRERRGIARRERQINRRRRIEQFAEGVDRDVGDDVTDIPDRAYDDYISDAGRLANPERRRINTDFVRAMRLFDLDNEDKRNRLFDVAEGEYRNLDGFWARRLGRRDFTLKDINLHIRKHEQDPEDEATPDGLRALRDDWAELRPLFDPVDGDFDLHENRDEVVRALGRLDSDRKKRIIQGADLRRTEELQDIEQAQNDAERQILKEIEGDRNIIDMWERKLRNGTMTEGGRQRLLAFHGELALNEDRYRQIKENADKRLADFDARGDGSPQERAKLVAAQRAAQMRLSGAQGLRKKLTDLRRQHPELDRQINDRRAVDKAVVPVAPDIHDVPTEGFKIFGEPGTKPSFMGSIGELDDNGLPVLKRIENPEITSPEDAVAFVRDGGSLSEVPNAFWHEALRRNASVAETDKAAKFRFIQASNGIQGNTVIYRARDENGVMTNKGYVVKQMPSEIAAAREQAGWAVLNLAGVVPDVPGMDGQENRKNWRGKDVLHHNVVLPFVGNVAPNGDFIWDQMADFNLARLQAEHADRAAPERLANILGNFLAAAGDRHDGNAMSFQVDPDGRHYAVPVDMGMAMRLDGSPIKEPLLAGYLRDVNGNEPRDGPVMLMDRDYVKDINTHLGGLDEADGIEQAQEIIDTYDRIVANARRIRGVDSQQWAANLRGANSPTHDSVREEGHEVVLAQLDKLERERDEFIKQVVPENLLNQIRDTRLDEANRVPNDPDRQAKWAGNALVPEAEVSVNFELDTPRKAGEHVKNGGDIAELPDQVYIHGMLGAGDLVDAQGKAVDVDEILGLKRRLPKRMSNDKFGFDLIKEEGRGDFVYQVVDKNDPQKVYFLKTGEYGAHEIMHELVGAEVARIFGFDTDEKAGNVRAGPPIEGRPRQRWMVTPHVANYNEKEGRREKWGEAAKTNYNGQLHVQDLAQLGVMDYLVNNQDRHHRNALVVQQGGQYRIAPIDQGLIGLARQDGRMGGGSLSERLATWADISPRRFAEKGTNNAFKWFVRTQEGQVGFGFRVQAGVTPAKRTELLRRMEEVVRNVKNVNVDDLFDPERLGRRGVDWTSTELQHIEAIKTIFQARLDRVQDNARQEFDRAIT